LFGIVNVLKTQQNGGEICLQKFFLRITHFARTCWGFGLQKKQDFIPKSRGGLQEGLGLQ
jgi:hypothetical protein